MATRTQYQLMIIRLMKWQKAAAMMEMGMGFEVRFDVDGQ